MLKKALFLLVAVAFATHADGAPHVYSATAAVNVTSDTAASAKNIALDGARRQVVREALGPYADKEALAAAVKAASAADLMNLVAASSIDGEQQSATTYSANITMTLDGMAVRKWLSDNNVQSWLPDTAGGGQILVVVTLRDRVADWMQLNQIARGENVELNTRSIAGNQLTLSMPESGRRMFLAAARSAGWQSTDDGGVLRIWK